MKKFGVKLWSRDFAKNPEFANQSVAAVKEGKDSYTIITRRNVVLQFGDVIKRVSDGGMFTITSNGKDRATPQGAGLDMRAVKAVEFVG